MSLSDLWEAYRLEAATRRRKSLLGIMKARLVSINQQDFEKILEEVDAP